MKLRGYAADCRVCGCAADGDSADIAHSKTPAQAGVLQEGIGAQGMRRLVDAELGEERLASDGGRGGSACFGNEAGGT